MSSHKWNLAYRVPVSEQPKVIASIVMGFADDPTARWCWPDVDTYLKVMPQWSKASGDEAFKHGTALYKSGCGALWLPPDVTSDDARMDALIKTTMTEKQQDTVAVLFEKLTPFEPKSPHWYLPLIGADLITRGSGAGTALMHSVTSECDRMGDTAYLVCSNPTNIGFYQRQGFEVMDHIYAEDFPVMIPMLRPPS
ncbi:GNAT family N-acetyltransferase [Photobacterium makurazakiensis]|uniref:GNAT family N-acetyltransferase n=1 Tax=Photobacterium makurazakiensis TaxID=2910234 RepID=UPI003D1389D7